MDKEKKREALFEYMKAQQYKQDPVKSAAVSYVANHYDMSNPSFNPSYHVKLILILF